MRSRRGLRLLGGVAEALAGRVRDPGDVVPDVLERLALRLIEVDLQPVHTGRTVALGAYPSFRPPLFQLFEPVAPPAGWAGQGAPPLELPRITVRSRGGEVVEPVASAVVVNVAVAAQLLRAVRLAAAAIGVEAPIPDRLVGLGIEQEDVRDVAVLVGRVVALGPLPGDLVAVVARPEGRIHQELEVVAGRGVAVEVDAPRRLEDAVQLHHALGHHREVGHHVVLAEELAHRLEQVGETLGALHDDLPVGDLGLDAPVPGVVEGVDLGGGGLAARLLEEDVVGGVRVEGRVEVDEVDALVLHALAQDGEVVAEVEGVGGVRHGVMVAGMGRVGARGRWQVGITRWGMRTLRRGSW